MVQRDIIQEQIEQLGRVLGKILAQFLALKLDGDPANAVLLTQEELRGQLKLNLKKFMELDEAAAIAYADELGLTGEHLDQLADYAWRAAEAQPERRTEHLRTARRLLTFAELRSDTVTFERIFLKDRIDTALRAMAD